MKESSKSLRRRWVEHELGVFPWRDLFKGFGLDVGAGDDPLPFDSCMAFDQKDGDANHLSEQVRTKVLFNYIHASQCLEHLHDAEACLRDWLTLLVPGGHIIVTVPDIGAYEALRYPSRFNGDHKCSFSMIYRGSMFPRHYHIPTLCQSLFDVAETRLARYVEYNFDWNHQHDRDQTFIEEDQVECWNEIVLQKHDIYYS